MFEQLIESEKEGAEFRTRKSYFMMSSIVVGTLFLTAVVISIYAADYNLGSAAFELVEMVAPPEMAAVAPEPHIQRAATSANATQSQLPTRLDNTQRTEESPAAIPTSLSVVPGPKWTRPPGDFVVTDHMPPGQGGSGRGPVDRSTGETGIVRDAAPSTIPDNETDAAPPRVHSEPAVKPPPVKTMGVVNGKASYLPKPVYSAAAIAVHAEGKVDVQVTIDETGRVISAQAVTGHPMLRPLAEQAARNARFTPTLLSLVPVRVTGVIVYNFTR